jgi:hypothetical protein
MLELVDTDTGVGTATADGVICLEVCLLLIRSEAAPTPTARPAAKIPPWMIGLAGILRVDSSRRFMLFGLIYEMPCALWKLFVSVQLQLLMPGT